MCTAVYLHEFAYTQHQCILWVVPGGSFGHGRNRSGSGPGHPFGWHSQLISTPRPHARIKIKNHHRYYRSWLQTLPSWRSRQLHSPLHSTPHTTSCAPATARMTILSSYCATCEKTRWWIIILCILPYNSKKWNVVTSHIHHFFINHSSFVPTTTHAISPKPSPVGSLFNYQSAAWVFRTTHFSVTFLMHLLDNQPLPHMRFEAIKVSCFCIFNISIQDSY